MSNVKSCPVLKSRLENLTDYDIIYIGFPIWWSLVPRIINTFIESGDLAGRTITPFVTPGSSSISNAEKELQETYPDMKWQKGRLLSGTTKEDIKKWTKKQIVMRKGFGAKPFTYLQPVFIIAAYDESGTSNAMSAVWGGISEMYKISICINEGHKATANILKCKAFTVSMAEAGQVVSCDHVGIIFGNKVSDKFVRVGFHATRSEFVDVPLIDELFVVLECILKDYNPETCILRGEIIDVSVDERALDENGKVDVSKVSPIIFDSFSNDYLKAGKKVGNAFSDGKRLK